MGEERNSSLKGGYDKEVSVRRGRAVKITGNINSSLPEFIQHYDAGQGQV